MISFAQYCKEGIIGSAARLGARAGGAAARVAGKALQQAPAAAAAAGKFMKQGPSITGTLAKAGSALTAVGGKLNQYGQGVLTKQDGSSNIDIPTYQNLVANGTINLNLPSGKTNVSQLAVGDVYSVVNKKTGTATQNKVVNKQGNILQIVDAGVEQKKV